MVLASTAFYIFFLTHSYIVAIKYYTFLDRQRKKVQHLSLYQIVGFLIRRVVLLVQKKCQRIQAPFPDRKYGKIKREVYGEEKVEAALRTAFMTDRA